MDHLRIVFFKIETQNRRTPRLHLSTSFRTRTYSHAVAHRQNNRCSYLFIPWGSIFCEAQSKGFVVPGSTDV